MTKRTLSDRMLADTRITRIVWVSARTQMKPTWNQASTMRGKEHVGDSEESTVTSRWQSRLPRVWCDRAMHVTVLMDGIVRCLGRLKAWHRIRESEKPGCGSPYAVDNRISRSLRQAPHTACPSRGAEFESGPCERGPHHLRITKGYSCGLSFFYEQGQ